MKGKIAIVTGGSRGIGRAVCETLAAAGANVVINYAGNEAAAKETESICKSFGVETLIVQGDIASSEDCSRIVDEAIKTFGTVDILINNAESPVIICSCA